jgi:replicative superfamily II helicase
LGLSYSTSLDGTSRLVFVDSREKARTLSWEIAQLLLRHGLFADAPDDHQQKLCVALQEAVAPEKMATYIRTGVLFHTTQLTISERRAVEKALRHSVSLLQRRPFLQESISPGSTW